MTDTRLIPWRRIAYWKCLACGECCRYFEVPLGTSEYARITRFYSLNIVRLDVGRAYLRKTVKGRCIFQRHLSGRWLCSLGGDKPLACKIWPFAALKNPRYGRDREALYDYYGDRYYVYVHPYCRGLLYGEPSSHIMDKVIPEVLELTMKPTTPQKYTTADLAGEAVETIHSILYKSPGKL
ncbi:MAG: YkgJ family cysteine cluster protein [Candidatus Bathyarchaeia archaeon]